MRGLRSVIAVVGAAVCTGALAAPAWVVDAITETTLVEATPQSRFPFPWASDDSERLRVDSFDASGNYVGSAFTNAPTFVSNFGAPPDADATYAGAWSTQTTASALGGSLHFSTKKGASATFAANVRTLAWITTVGPTHGSA